MSPALNGSFALERFKHGNAIKIRNEILFNFYLVTSTKFWSSQLHACCVRDALQTSKGIFLFESKLKCSREASPSMRIFLQKAGYSYLVTHLAILPQPCNQALLQGQMCRNNKPHQKCYTPSKRRQLLI